MSSTSIKNIVVLTEKFASQVKQAQEVETVSDPDEDTVKRALGFPKSAPGFGGPINDVLTSFAEKGVTAIKLYATLIKDPKVKADQLGGVSAVKLSSDQAQVTPSLKVYESQFLAAIQKAGLKLLSSQMKPVNFRTVKFA